MHIGDIENMAEEVQQFYPDKIHGAIGYLESRYELDIFHASHIASILWGLLNNKNPIGLPKYLVLHASINSN